MVQPIKRDLVLEEEDDLILFIAATGGSDMETIDTEAGIALETEDGNLLEVE